MNMFHFIVRGHIDIQIKIMNEKGRKFSLVKSSKPKTHSSSMSMLMEDKIPL